jgi:hypothetical protein
MSFAERRLCIVSFLYSHFRLLYRKGRGWLAGSMASVVFFIHLRKE